MFPRRVFTFLNIAGIVLDVLGLLLPWAEWTWAPGVYATSYTVLGINYPLGPPVLVGWLIATVSLMIFIVKSQRVSLGFLMIIGIVTMICSFFSIASPGAFTSPNRIFTASYGAYVSFTGGALILVGSTFSSWTWNHVADRLIRQNLRSQG